MPPERLLSFTGDDLAIREIGDMEENGKRKVVLQGIQTSDQFLSFCRSNTAATVAIPRRALLANGIGFAMDQSDIEGHQITMQGTMFNRALPTSDMYEVGEKILGSLTPGMFIAKPFNTNGRKPLQEDQLRYQLSQLHIKLPTAEVENLSSNWQDGLCTLHGDVGLLRYYPEINGGHPEIYRQIMENRLRLKPGQIDEHSKPIFRPATEHLQAAGALIGLRLNNLQALYHSLIFKGAKGEILTAVQSPDRPIVVFDQNTNPFPSQMHSIPSELYDRRHRTIVAVRSEEQKALPALTQNYQTANEFIQHIFHLAGNQDEKRVAALVRNRKGMDEILKNKPHAWISKDEQITAEDRRERVHLEQTSALGPGLNTLCAEGSGSSEIRLIKRAMEVGMDSGATLVCETFPSFAALRGVIGSEVFNKKRVVEALLFRRVSIGNHPGLQYHFSQSDYNALWDFLINNIQVMWANPMMKHLSADGKTDGALLELAQMEEKKCIAFVPPNRKEEFMKGMHLTFYGTARTLRPEYVQFMEGLFPLLKSDASRQPFVVNSGGGPDISTMGIANRLAQEQGFLSIGHVLGVGYEPTNQYLDGIMPLENDFRGVRQQNMAHGTDVAVFLEGGGGTEEERGITRTDIAILKSKRAPMILIGDAFHKNIYEQYLQELSEGAIDAKVIDCISLIALSTPEEAARVINAFRDTGEVIRSIPHEYEARLAQAKLENAKWYNQRREAWTHHQ